MQTIFDVLRIIFVDVHRALGHREERLRRLDILGHLGFIETRSHLLDRIELVTDAPDHEVNVRTKSDCRIRMNQQRGSKLIDSLNKLIATALLVGVREQAPFRSRVIKREVNKLSGQLSLFEFHGRVRRGETKRTACGITLILVATHCFYLGPGLQRLTLEESTMQSYSAQSQGRMQPPGESCQF